MASLTSIDVCKPNVSPTANQIPPNFQNNTSAKCGITWPQSTPFLKISPCCTSPVKTEANCFQYCETILDATAFSDCALRNINDTSLIAVDATCNHQADLSGAASDVPGCNPSQPTPQRKQPDGFLTNKTPMCGLNWPQSTPFTNISSCCAGPVMVKDDCFQYCAADLGELAFENCLSQVIFSSGIYLPHGLSWTCNNRAQNAAASLSLRGSSWLLLLGGVMATGVLNGYARSALLVAGLGLLMVSTALV